MSISKGAKETKNPILDSTSGVIATFIMPGKKDQIEQDTQTSIARRKALPKQFVSYEFELETGRQLAKIKKKLDLQSNVFGSTQSNNVVVECDEVHDQGANSSVESTIKTKAVNLCP